MNKHVRIKKVMSTLLIFVLVLSSMTGITAGMYNDGKYGNVVSVEGNKGYEEVFLTELPDNKDLDITKRGFLNVRYFQTSDFTHPGDEGPTLKPDNSDFWTSLGSELVKDVDGRETYIGSNYAADADAQYTAVGTSGRIYVGENKLDNPTTGETSPYGKKMIIRGFIVPTQDVESIQLGTYSDDGTIVTFDGVQIINNWKYQAPKLVTADITNGEESFFEAGSIHTITIEYYENRKTQIAFMINNGEATMPGDWFYPYRTDDGDKTTVVDIVTPAENMPVEKPGTKESSIAVTGTTEPGNKEVKVFVVDDVDPLQPKSLDGLTFDSVGGTTISTSAIDLNGDGSLNDWASASYAFDISYFTPGPFKIIAITKDPYGNIATDVHVINKLQEYEFMFKLLDNSIGLGTITTEPVVSESTNTLIANAYDKIQITAVPKPGYEFVQWWGEFPVKYKIEEGDDSVSVPSEKRITVFNQLLISEGISTIKDTDSILKPLKDTGIILKPLKDIRIASDILDVDGKLESNIDADTSNMIRRMPGRVNNIYAEFRLIKTPTPNPDPTPNPTLYTLTVNVVGEGSVPGFEGTNSFSSGTNVNLSAVIDNPLYEFVGWSGDLVSTSLAGSVALTGNKTVTATFALIGEEPIPQDVPEEVTVKEETVEQEVVLDVITEAIPEAVTELPATGGLPVELFALLGTSILGVGAVLKKKTK